MSRLATGAVIIAGGVAVLWAIGASHGAGMSAADSAAACSKDGAALAQYLAAEQRAGTIGARDQVSELAWAALDHDHKVQLAFAVFCRDAVAGRATVTLRGLHDGQAKAAIVDGNYSDR